MIRSRAVICDNNLITGQLSRLPPFAAGGDFSRKWRRLIGTAKEGRATVAGDAARCCFD